MKNLLTFYLFALLSMFGVSAFAAPPSVYQTTLAAVDFTGIATWVGIAGIAIIGITMAFKGIDLGKRGVRKA